MRVSMAFAGLLLLAACGEVDAPNAEPAPTPAASEIVANDHCGINAPTPGGEYERSARFPVWGYAFDKVGRTVPAAVSVRIASLDGGQSTTVAAARGARHDVAEALKQPEFENSGFGAEVDVTTLPPGSYMVSVLQEIRGQVHVCNNPLPITFK